MFAVVPVFVLLLVFHGLKVRFGGGMFMGAAFAWLVALVVVVAITVASHGCIVSIFAN